MKKEKKSSFTVQKRWMTNYQLAKKFYQKHGHFPSRREKPRLYLWARQWWRRCCRANPNGWAVYADKLTAIGFFFCSGEQKQVQVWQMKYERARQFYEEHGHFPSLTEDKHLHEWARQWCSHFGHANPAKVQMLAEIGYVYQTAEEWNEKYWNRNYRECKTFFEEHNRFPSLTDNRRLFTWAGRWWQKSAAGQPDKADLLKEIGFKP